MPTQILTTKLFIPSPPPNLVSRPRLLARLERGSTGKLTLISAQAGFGKTTLLSEWINQYDHAVCWLSLDELDNNLHRFLKYFIAALGTILPDIGVPALLELHSAKPNEAEPLLTGLINEITASADHFVFVLDDYHVVTAPEIQRMLLFLLEHMPPQMHLVISSRADPPWPLARFKVCDEIQEIRSRDMRFSAEEATIFLNKFMGLVLSSEEIAALEERTEGWIVGLQLAAISLQTYPNRDAFIQAFTGSHRFVVDYLVEEVLNQQPPEIQEFLLKTSILDRFTGSLCDAVLDRQESQVVLAELEAKNLFVIPLDDERRWYRYHHLFADLLQHHLDLSWPGIKLELHKKASIWYEQNGLFTDAVNHALAANDIERIVQLTEDITVHKLDYGEQVVLWNWLERLPETAIVRYPWLHVARTWTLFNLGRYEAVENQLALIERVLSGGELSDQLATRIRGHAAAIRSYYAELLKDPQTARQQAETAYDLLSAEDTRLRAFVAIRLANIQAWLGELGRAIQNYEEAGKASRQVGEGQLAITAFSEAAVLKMLTGNLRQAAAEITEITRYADKLAKRDGRRLPAMGILYRHVSYIKREQNELDEAAYYAREAIKICKQWGEKESLLYALWASARVQFAQGDLDQAEHSFENILQIAGEISPEYAAQFEGYRIQYELLQGNLDQVERWLNTLDLTADDIVPYDRQLEYMNYARYMAAQGYTSKAIRVVDKLLQAGAAAGAGMFTIQYRLLQSILFYKLNRKAEALSSLREALILARAEGYVRSILDEGEAVGDLLKIAIAAGIEVVYAGKLLRALTQARRQSPAQIMQAEGLIDPLSAREVEVLRFLSTDLSTPEIARELHISVSTVRSHIKQIYSKLDVHSRFEAVSKAEEFNLF